MTTQRIREINVERLSGWAEKLTEQHATAALLVGISHDHVKGEVHIVVPDNFPDTMILPMLQGLVSKLQRRN